MARTTLDLDEELIAKGMAVSGVRSKKALIEAAVEELIRSRARQELLEHIRNGEAMGGGMSLEELLAWRRSGPKRIFPLDDIGE